MRSEFVIFHRPFRLGSPAHQKFLRRIRQDIHDLCQDFSSVSALQQTTTISCSKERCMLQKILDVFCNTSSLENQHSHQVVVLCSIRSLLSHESADTSKHSLLRSKRKIMWRLERYITVRLRADLRDSADEQFIFAVFGWSPPRFFWTEAHLVCFEPIHAEILLIKSASFLFRACLLCNFSGQKGIFSACHRFLWFCSVAMHLLPSLLILKWCLLLYGMSVLLL